MFTCSNRIRTRALAILALIATFIAFNGLVAITAPQKAEAAPITDWQAGYIISDANFYTQGNMSVSQIQTFLNNKGKYCNGSRCLKNYRGNLASFSAGSCPSAVTGGSNLSAAEMIYRVSRACKISAKVLLVTLEKENGLVTSPAWYNSRTGANAFRTALGYGCPDTAPCDAQYFGVGNQLYHAAKQFNIYKKYPNYYNFRSGKTSWVGYNPSSACGGSNVYMRNAATAGLYNYTPYQPNAAALRAGLGAGNSCSSYGNRNFYYLYKSWFGSPRAASKRTVTQAQIKALSPVISDTDLKSGMWNDTIKKLQAAMLLAVPSYPLFTPDGGYGAKTTEIVKQFQSENGLYPSGVVNQETSYTLLRKGFPVYVFTPHTYYGTLGWGARSDAVTTLQIGAKALFPQWYSAGIDGLYGAKSTAFVKAFQKSKGLSESGTVDEATAQQLRQAGIPISLVAVADPKPIYLRNTLWKGAWNDDVLQVQRALVKKFPRYAQFQPDGGFGAKTEAAVKAVQRANGIYPDGGVGPKTVELFRKNGIEAGMFNAAKSTTALNQGVWNSAVTTLQQGLRKYFPESFPCWPDGVFGAKTEAGVKAVQKHFGLPETGFVDKATADQLRSLGVPLTISAPPEDLSQTLNTPLGQWQWNSQVMALQKILKYYFPAQTPYTPDGGYGVGSKAGMIKVQNLLRITPTGVFDQETAAKLQEYGVPLSYK